jgi:hypothetical protein
LGGGRRTGGTPVPPSSFLLEAFWVLGNLEPFESLAKFIPPVILRERRDRRISIIKGKYEILRFAQDDKKAFGKSLFLKKKAAKLV